MDATPNLDLPYIMGAQAQKHVTHNEAIRKLDALVQLTVLDRDLATPPPSPADGDRYIVASGASDAWSDHDLEIAAFQDGAWAFYSPAGGWLAWLADDNALVAWDGSAWVAAGGTASLTSATLVGVNTTADATNRLAVKSDAILFSHDDVTPGSGNQRTVLNKAAAGNTASYLFQSNFSGRAEVGLVGNDDFSFKVSPDGGTWHEALVLKKDGSAIAAGLPVQHSKPPRMPSYTTATLPSVTTYGAGSLIYVSDWPAGGATLMSDGTQWRRVSPRRASVSELLAGDEGIAINFRAREALVNDHADVLTLSGRPADFLTLTRASDATYFGRDGLLATASSNALRFHHDPATREPRGLLIEGAATNLHKRSETLDTWSNISEVTVTANAAVAPDGTTTADLLVPSTTNTANHFIRDTKDIAITSGTTYVGSIFVKAGGYTRVRLSFDDQTWGSGHQAGVFFNLADGSAYNASASVVAARATALGNGWWRLELVSVPTLTTNTRMTLWVANPDGSAAGFVGDGSGVYAWGAQFEAGSVATSYIPTTSASATRAADSIVIGPDTFPVLAGGDCTLYWRGRIIELRRSGEGILLSANDNSADEVIALREGASIAGADATVTDGGSSVADTASKSITLRSDAVCGLSVRANDLKLYANGAPVGTDSSLTMPTIDQLTITPGAGSIYEIDEIAYIARARTAGELAALTTV